MPKLTYTREEMLKINTETLLDRGVRIEDIALIAYNQQKKYADNIDFDICVESVKKILSYRDTFHHIQLGVQIDIAVEKKLFTGPIQDILYYDLGLFGIDEVVGLDIAGNYGAVGKTNFGDIDVNKPGICKKLNDEGKTLKRCHTFLDDIVGAIAAAASTRVAQIMLEFAASNDANIKISSLFDEE